MKLWWIRRVLPKNTPYMLEMLSYSTQNYTSSSLCISFINTWRLVAFDYVMRIPIPLVSNIQCLYSIQYFIHYTLFYTLYNVLYIIQCMIQYTYIIYIMFSFSNNTHYQASRWLSKGQICQRFLTLGARWYDDIISR